MNCIGRLRRLAHATRCGHPGFLPRLQRCGRAPRSLACVTADIQHVCVVKAPLSWLAGLRWLRVSTKPGAGHRLLLNGRDISKSPSRKFEFAILSRSSASFSQFAASNSQKALSASFNEISAFLWHRTASFRYSSASPDIFTVFQLQLGRLLDARLRIKMGQISGNCQRTRPRVRSPFARMLPRVMGVGFCGIMAQTPQDI